MIRTAVMSLAVLGASGPVLYGRVIRQGEVRTVALSGHHAPGTPLGVTFGHFPFLGPPTFMRPLIDEVGQVAFSANLVGPGVQLDLDQFNGRGIWSEGSGTLSLVVRAGDAAPGGGTFSDASGGSLNFESGIATFPDSVGGDSGTFSNRSGSIEKIGPYFHPVMNASGQIAFSSDDAIWSDVSGTFTQLAVKGAEAPGTTEGTRFGRFATGLTMNNSGRVAFGSMLGGAEGRNGAFWTAGPDGLEMIARKGDLAPGLGETRFQFLAIYNGILINDEGEVAFLAALSPDDLQLDSVWKGGIDDLELVARAGQIAPGTNEPFVRFESVYINADGDTAFLGILPGPAVDGLNQDEGIWAEKNGVLSLVARVGELAPGTSNYFFNIGAAVGFNRHGQVAFEAITSRPGPTGAGLWATDSLGTLHSLVDSGDRIEVAPGDFRSVTSPFDMSGGSGNQDGLPSGFNERGQLVFHARFSDGSEGIFVSNLVAVPEPGLFPYLVTLLLFAGIRFVCGGRDTRASICSRVIR